MIPDFILEWLSDASNTLSGLFVEKLEDFKSLISSGFNSMFGFVIEFISSVFKTVFSGVSDFFLGILNNSHDFAVSIGQSLISGLFSSFNFSLHSFSSSFFLFFIGLIFFIFIAKLVLN
ncbi:MAG: hypothetical protein K2H19_06035, partial [Ruminococcus sp.]|nr:hypothetical protein [Ruminococcus sp.]